MKPSIRRDVARPLEEGRGAQPAGRLGELGREKKKTENMEESQKWQIGDRCEWTLESENYTLCY